MNMRKDNLQSKEFVSIDFDEVMSSNKILSNTELIKNFDSIKKNINMKNSNKDILNKPYNENAKEYNFYLGLHKNSEVEEMKSLLAQAIELKTKAPYTHALISLDIDMTSALGMVTEGLVREFPDFYGYYINNM